jgi:acyl-CoA synthetase (NDP forming)
VDEARAICQAIAGVRGDTWLTSHELDAVLRKVGVTVVRSEYGHAEDEIVRLAASLAGPIVLKIDAPGVLHKTDAGGVRVNLRSEPEIREAFRDLARRFPGVLDPASGARVRVQPMVPGIETLVGVVDDPVFGPLIGFGLGGIHTEVLRDVAFRLAPLTEPDADKLLRGIKGFRLLQGYRGQPAADIDALQDLLLRVSLLVQHVPELRELDLNPVMALPPGQGCCIVDARGRIARS